MKNKKLFLIGLIAQAIVALLAGATVVISVQTGITNRIFNPFLWIIGIVSTVNVTLMYKGLKGNTFIKKCYIFIISVCVILIILGLLGSLGVLPIS